MERTVVLTIDEGTIVIGLLDLGWSGERPDEHLVAMAHRYRDLLRKRVEMVDADGGDTTSLAVRVAAAQHESVRLRAELDERLAESRSLRARRDELRDASRVALTFLGASGPLSGRPADDPELTKVRARLRLVTSAA